MKIVDIIEKKRDNKELTREEVSFFVKEYVKGNIKDYQASSLLMAIYINGLTEDELYNLTSSMAYSSSVIDLSGLKKEDEYIVDKHSTGGVGDKVTLIVLSIVSCFGVKVFKMSGRGLGITGGTADKLESIKGYKLNLSFDKIKKQMEDINICLVSQSDNLAVADKKLYSLRDVTGTVSSIDLIASSIMSKKIASGVDKLVINVTFGKGSFMKTLEEAKKLSKTMINIGKKCNIEVKVVITSMDTPLGRNIGNSLEIEEIIEFLSCNDIEKLSKDIMNTVYEIATQMILLSGKYDNKEEIVSMIDEYIISGKAYENFINLIKYQKGKVKKENNKLVPMLKNETKYKGYITSNKDGFVTKIDALKLGNALIEIGGGRKRKEESIDYAVGFKILKDIGETVIKGDKLLEVCYNDKNKINEALKCLEDTFEISDSFEEEIQYIYDVI